MTMTVTALIVSLVSLVIALIAYWRSGGKRDLHQAGKAVRREIDMLHAKHKELIDHALALVTAAYDHSRRRLEASRERLARLEQTAVEGIQHQLKHAGEHLEALAQHLEDSVGASRDVTVAVAREAEAAIARRVRRIQARVMLLEAKGKASRAQNAGARGEFDKADHLLHEATEAVREAHAVLQDDHGYDAEIRAIKSSLRKAAVAVRRQAKEARQHIEEALARTDRVVTTLHSEEQSEAK